jgi:hypothetical protein
LPSGQAHLETHTKGSLLGRGLARIEAIRTTLDLLDEQAVRLKVDPHSTKAYSERSLDELSSRSGEGGPHRRLVDQLRKGADAALARGPYSVVDKTNLPPSGDIHDYWHPAPYWWPNPKSADGLPYIRRDGIRVPGTRLYEPESEKFDRTRLQRLFDDTTILALAWRVTGEQAYAEHAAKLIRTWFIRPETRMNPNLRYAQVRSGHQNNEGAHTGIIEMKDFYYFLDGVRLVERAGSFDASDRQALTEWLREYVKWLFSSQQGKEERRANNNHGTCFDLQVAAIAEYLGDIKLLLSTLRTSHERLLEQFDSDGRQPHEMKRTITAHYCSFNLQSWANLADLAERCGIDFWNIAALDGRGLRRAFEWMSPYIAGKPWTESQVEPFDTDRFIPLYFLACDHYDDIPGLDRNLGLNRLEAKPLFFPHDGIKPFWMVG